MTTAEFDLRFVAFRGRVMQDVYLMGLAISWERRAMMFDECAPRRGDYLGAGRGHLWNPAQLPDDVLERADRCAEAARACRSHAQVLDLRVEEFRETVAAVGEVAA